jgi:hypothetical protein
MFSTEVDCKFMVLEALGRFAVKNDLTKTLRPSDERTTMMWTVDIADTIPKFGRSVFPFKCTNVRGTDTVTLSSTKSQLGGKTAFKVR